jgi:hypothetical protein
MKPSTPRPLGDCPDPNCNRDMIKRLPGGTRKLWGLMDVFIVLIEEIVSQNFTYAKIYYIVHFKHITFLSIILQ